MLFEFLNQYKKEIMFLCRNKIHTAGDSKPTSALLDGGLPIFYTELTDVLSRSASATNESPENKTKAITRDGDAAVHGKESLRLGYTISQVVHACGAVCQTITEFVQTKGYKITPQEFHDLNLCLDCAIAEAVTEFEKSHSENVSSNEAQRLGFFIHEMGNSLAAASIAHDMIQKGHVGTAGTTSQILSRALDHMRHLIGCRWLEVRLGGQQATVEPTQMRLIDVVSEVEATSLIKKNPKDIHLELDIDPAIQLTADRHLVFSALSNLVNNAIKFTKKDGNVTVRSKESGERLLIEVEDECGGLPQGESEELFKPFVQRGTDKSGLGLGLSLSRRAIELNQGTLTARNMGNKGCVFTIDLPKMKKVA